LTIASLLRPDKSTNHEPIGLQCRESLAKLRSAVLIPKDNLALPIYRPYTSRMVLLKRFIRDEQGQDLIEYTLLMAFIALASAVIFVKAGKSVSGIWGIASNQLSNAAAAAS
jgi:Flp pilus assembly pilin Flp